MAPRACIVALTSALAAEVAANLRARDRAEVLAAVPSGMTAAEGMAWWLDHITEGGESWAALVDGVPVAMGGLRGLDGRPDLAASWAVGTDRKMAAGVAIFLHAVRIHERWTDLGVRRFQCSCLDSPEESSEWLLRLGYQREGVLRSFGRNGEDFIIWGRIHGR